MAAAELERAAEVMSEFLVSKSLFSTERALRAELAIALQEEADAPGSVTSKSLFVSKLDHMLELQLAPAPIDRPSTQIEDLSPPQAQDAGDFEGAKGPISPASRMNASATKSRRNRVRLFTMGAFDPSDERVLRKQRGRGTPQSRVVFHEPPHMTDAQANTLAHISLPLLYNPHINGLEDSRELPIGIGALLIGRYRVVAMIGKGSFSRVLQCLDLRTKAMVSVKVLRNEKDCLDAGLGEVRILALLAKHDPKGEQPLVRLRDYFYYKEHLLIVTELLRDSLFHFYKYVDAEAENGLASYFTPRAMSVIAAQLLRGVQFVHDRGLVHCDLKPENVCLVSASRHKVKIIDFGSAVLSHDTKNSYVQSRWYRAPEVMLGMPWDAKADIWSLGCLLAELVVGYPLFYGSTVEHVLAAQQAVLGRHPASLLASAHPDTLAMFFAPDGAIFSVDPQGYPTGVYELQPQSTPLRTLAKLDDEPLLDFIASLLSYDPEKRPTAAQALSHPFILAHGGRSPTGPPVSDAEAALAHDANRRSEASDCSASSAGPMLHHAKGCSISAIYDSPAESPGGSDYPSTASSASASPQSSPQSSPRTGTRSIFERRSSSARGEKKARGPGVPEDFRNSITEEHLSRRQHDWKSRIARLISPASGGSAFGVAPLAASVAPASGGGRAGTAAPAAAPAPPPAAARPMQSPVEAATPATAQYPYHDPRASTAYPATASQYTSGSDVDSPSESFTVPSGGSSSVSYRVTLPTAASSTSSPTSSDDVTRPQLATGEKTESPGALSRPKKRL